MARRLGWIIALLAASCGSPSAVPEPPLPLPAPDPPASLPETLRFAASGRVRSLSFSADGETLLSAGSSLEAWRLDRGARVPASPGRRGYYEGNDIAAFAPDEGSAAGLHAMEVRVFNTEAWTLRYSFEIEAIPSSCAFSPDLTRFYAIQDGAVVAWAMAPGTRVRKSNGQISWDSYPGTVLRRMGTGASLVAVSPDGSLVGAAGPGAIVLWDLNVGEPILRLQTEEREPFALAFSADGRLLASSGRSRKLSVWEIASGTRVIDPPIAGNVYAIAFAPTGTLVATGRSEKAKEVTLQNAVTGEEVTRFAGSDGPTLCLAFSPDGTKLAAGGIDKTILVWPFEPRRPLVPPEGPSLQECWTALIEPDAVRAYASMVRLSRLPEGPAFLAGNLRAPSESRPTTERLIARLAQDDPAGRDEAFGLLKEAGVAAEATLRSVADAAKDSDIRGRLDELLRVLNSLVAGSRERLRRIRAIQVLEWAEAGAELRSVGETTPSRFEKATIEGALGRLRRVARKSP